MGKLAILLHDSIRTRVVHPADLVWGKWEVWVYSIQVCNNCRMVKEFLKAKSVDFTDINIAADADARNRLIEKTGHIWAPVVQIGKEFIFGYDPKKMEILVK